MAKLKNNKWMWIVGILLLVILINPFDQSENTTKKEIITKDSPLAFFMTFPIPPCIGASEEGCIITGAFVAVINIIIWIILVIFILTKIFSGK